MQGKAFLVNATPYCLFDDDVKGHNTEFLTGLDAGFFKYMTDSHIVLQEDPMQWSLRDEAYSPVALRLAYHHSLETLFSLIGIFLQAPDCGFAWLPRCSTSDLGSVVRRISAGDRDLFTRFKLDEMSWERVAQAVFSPCPREHKQALVGGFGALWAQLAGFFDDEVQQAEYNSMKHGFRVHKGGVKISMTLHRTKDVSSDDDMSLVSDSQYGSGFFQVEKVEDGYNSLTTVRHGVNWSVMQQVNLNKLIYISINNLISALRLMDGWPGDEKCKFLHPHPIDSFGKAWENAPEILSFSMGHGTPGAKIPLFTKAHILERLRARGQNV